MNIQHGGWYFDHEGGIRGPMVQSPLGPDTWCCGDGYVWDAVGEDINSPIGKPPVHLSRQLPFGVKGPCIKTCKGIIFNLIKSGPEAVTLQDIAIPLSRIQRWGGQYAAWVPEYSVAAHSLNCVRLGRYLGFSRPALLAILLHDAAEAYVGDLVKPLKTLCESYSVVEDRIQGVIADAAGCDFEKYAEDIRVVDNALLVLEKNTIINGGQDWVYTFEDQALRVIPRKFELLFYPRQRLGRAWRFLRGRWSGGCPVREFVKAYSELGGI